MAKKKENSLTISGGGKTVKITANDTKKYRGVHALVPISKTVAKHLTKKQRKDLLDPTEYANVGMITAHLSLDTLALKALKWSLRLLVDEILPQSYHLYRMVLTLDEQPDIDRIADLEHEFDAGLFRNDAASKKKHNEAIARIRKSLDDKRDLCEKIEFVARVEELKYKDRGTLLTVRIPDDVIEPINRQKIRFNIYKIELVPVLGETK